ncbi:MAG: lysophospholipid acyltransferase family protein [Actinomycetota bacterium]|nr:lysophospholipid acyltransferase family protein [Actinomycetota bacterium]
MTLFASIARPLAWPLFMAAFRVRLIGRENIPTSGGAILAGNHVSYMDPVLLWEFAPRPTHFMAKSELFRGFPGWVLNNAYAFPVVRGSADRTAIATATKLLEDGELVGIFPEGTRSSDGSPGEAHGGVSFIAMRAGVPVIPVAFIGTDKVLPRGQKFIHPARVTIKFGAPIDPATFTEGSRKERMEALTATIMKRIAEELEAARRL